MAEYKDERKRKKSPAGAKSSSGGKAKGGASHSASKGSSAQRSGSGSRPTKNGSSSAAKSAGTKSSASKNSSTKSGGAKQSASKSGATKSGSPKSGTGAKSASSTSRSTSSKSGTTHKSTTGGKSTSKGNSSKSSASSKSVKSGSTAKNTSAKGASAASKAKTAQSASGAKVRDSYYRVMEEPDYAARRNTPDEQELHNSAEARRIAEVRRKKKYNRHRKLYNIMFYAAIFVAVVSVMIILSVTVLFNVRSIDITMGDGVPYTQEEVLEASRLKVGQNLLTAELDNAEHMIMSDLPYIEECVIERVMPSTISINTTVATALGVLTTTDGFYIIVSTGGRVLEMVTETTYLNGIPQIHGMNAKMTAVGAKLEIENENQLTIAAQIRKGMLEHGIPLKSITFYDNGTVSANYDGRVELNFGTPSGLENKMALAAVIINEEKVAKNESGDLDLTMEGKAVFTPDYLKKEEPTSDNEEE